MTLGIQTADQNARSLKKRFAQDDAGASSLLDKTEAERKDLARKEEGLRLALEELEPKITAAQQEITAARRVQDEQEEEQRFREACDKAAALVERVLALHAQACFDHTSLLKLIEWRFGLEPLTARDASHDIQNLARALNFHTPNAAVPNLPHPTAPTQTPCIQPDPPPPSSLADSTNPWPSVLESGLLEGWDIPK